VDAADLAVRNATYALLVELGRAPSADEAGAAAGLGRDELLAAWRRLHDAHALVLGSDGASIRMANPFAGVPTAHRVHARERWWYANCAWDAFGVCAALGTDGRIETSCPDCAQPIAVEVRDARPDDEALVFHCGVPAAAWWDDIVFT
jgi:Alkylmercury lyase